MFEGCSSLEKLDIGKFEPSRTEIMADMFKGCSALTELKLDSFDTLKVNNMDGMFSGVTSLRYLDLSKFYTKNVKEKPVNMWEGITNLKIKINKEKNEYILKDLPTGIEIEDSN